MPTSSMLTPASPAAWNSRASSPGWSPMTTWTSVSVRRRAAVACRESGRPPLPRVQQRRSARLRPASSPSVRPRSARPRSASAAADQVRGQRGEHLGDRRRRWRPGSASTGRCPRPRSGSRRAGPGRPAPARAPGASLSRAAMAAGDHVRRVRDQRDPAVVLGGDWPDRLRAAGPGQRRRPRPRPPRAMSRPRRRSPRGGRGTGRPAPRPGRTAPGRTAGARARTSSGRSPRPAPGPAAGS